MIEILPTIFTNFALGGGGGSSSIGSGSAEDIIALIGYVPSYYAGKIVKRLLPRKAELIVSSLTAATLSLLLLWISYKLRGSYTFMALIIIGIWAGWAAVFYDAWDKIKAKSIHAKQKLSIAASHDTTWTEDSLRKLAQDTFIRYQNDWTNFDIQSIQSYTTKRYSEHASVLLRILVEMRRKNVITNIDIVDSEFVEINDATNNREDSFKIAIKAKANDSIIDISTDTEKELFTNNNEVIECWTFVRSESTWLLDRIDQSTASVTLQDKSIEDFAQSRNMHYSVDMGWLFFPGKGVFFSGGAFGVSDINNHTAGIFNGHLVQLYTYSHMAGFPAYIVAQINLPKSYGGICVRQKKSSFWTAGAPPQKPPKDYKQYTMEWGDFNKRYEVLATDPDRLALFELLNPGFMAYLYDANPKICIEVTDNIVYLYKSCAQQKQAVPLDEYEKMFTILEKAYKELKL
ncbi:hypothetical protein KC953_02860 [Candidatus Saccharibacteria bacterium]|nr:hypothetical protein [Candidatus Saccharibacteria bacterium]